MNLKKLFSRLLMFVTGVPFVFFLCSFKPVNFACMHAGLTCVILCAAIEMHKLLSTKSGIAPKPILAILCTLPTLCSYLSGLFPDVIKTDYISMIAVFCILLIILIEFFIPSEKGENDFKNSLSSIAAGTFLFVYCGILPLFISRLSTFEYSVAYLCTFFTLAFGCDSLAWLFGMIFGKNNRGFIKISPNKSIAGFTGGILGTIALACLCKYVFKKSFADNSYIIMAVLGLTTSILAILGDLAESLLKRSSNCKDSGKIILGRGGMLDSVDSVLFSIPVYYYLIKYIISI